MALRQRCIVGTAAIALLASTALGAPNAPAAFGSHLPKHETISDTAKICAPGRFGVLYMPDDLRARVIEPAIFYAERRGELREFVEGVIAKYSRHLDLNHVWLGQNHNLGLWGAIHFENEKTGNGLTVASVNLTITINFYGKSPATRS